VPYALEFSRAPAVTGTCYTDDLETTERTAPRQRFDCRVDHDIAQDLPLHLQGREATFLDERAGDQNELRKESANS
jgi:hypothetical protein